MNTIRQLKTFGTILLITLVVLLILLFCSVSNYVLLIIWSILLVLNVVGIILTRYFIRAKYNSLPQYEKNIIDQYEQEQTEKYKQKYASRYPNPQEPIKCPRCGSTEYHAGKRGWKLTTGFLGSSKIIITCLACGKKWTPGS